MFDKLLGLTVVIAFVLLTFAIVVNSCTLWPMPVTQGFQDFPDIHQPSQPEQKMPVVGPSAQSLTGFKMVTGYSSVTDLPSAPINSLAETNSRPYQDPAMEKATRQMLNELKQDMDGFSAFEAPHLEGKSDPAIKLPLTRFQGDYQRVKDEIKVMDNNPGLQPQLSIQDTQDAGANLRFLQRTYRLYATNKMVPEPKADLSKAGISQDEGFSSNSKINFTKQHPRVIHNSSKNSRINPSKNPSKKPLEGFTAAKDPPISSDQLTLLSQKLAIEIIRLQASGATDPVLQARATFFTKIKQSVDDLITAVKNGTLDASAIPIKTSDYNKFLPALGDTSAGIGGLLSKSGNESLSSLFNSYEAGDISGAELAASLFDKYASGIVNNMSISIDYTSPNALLKSQADAIVAQSHVGCGAGSGAGSGDDDNTVSGFESGYGHSSRGEFENTIKSLDMSDNPRPSSNPPKSGHFDWKRRADDICLNIDRAGLNPKEFGCMPKGAVVSKDFSWRGQAKMMCSRLATHSDPAIPEQLGCPPVSWKGWRL